MFLSRALLIVTVAVVCVIEAVTHVACCSSPVKQSLKPPFEKVRLNATAQGRVEAELAAMSSGTNDFSLLSRPTFQSSVTLFVPATLQRPRFSRLIHLDDFTQDPVAALHWKALLQEALEDTRLPRRTRSKPGLAKQQAEGSDVVNWILSHYEAWQPPLVYGPPLPSERIRVQQQAHRLLQDLRAGRLVVQYDARDGEQLRAMERDGLYCWPAPPPGVSVRSPRQRDVLEGTLDDTPNAMPDAAADTRIAKSSERSTAKPLKKSLDGALQRATERPIETLVETSIEISGEGTREIASAARAKRLASRSTLPQRFPTANPADDPDFDPCMLPPAPGLLRMLTTLAAHSAPERPLTILSLLRPPYRFGEYVHVGPANPHSLGLAVDIAAYGGHSIRQSDPQECVAATLRLLHDLPPGHYRLGLPKAPEGIQALPNYLALLLAPPSMTSDAVDLTAQDTVSPSPASQELRAPAGCVVAALYGLHAGSERALWPFFPAPYTELVPAEGIAAAEVSEAEAMPVSTATKDLARSAWKRINHFQNESYALEADLNDARLQNAIAAARQRGVEVIALFPDGADHLHVDVRQNP